MKSRGLAVRTVHNSLWNLGAHGFSLAVTLITIPLYISLLGANKYGLMILLSSIIAPFGLLNFSMSQATVKFVAESEGRANREETGRYLQTTLLFNIIIGVIGAVSITLLAGFLSHVFKISAQDQALAQMCLYWVAVSWLIEQVAGTFSGIPMALQRYNLVSLANILSIGLQAAISLSVLYMGGNLINLFQSRLAVLVLLSIGWVILARWLLPGVSMHPGWHRDAFKRTFKFGSWQTVANIGGTLAHQGVDKIIIGMLLSTAAVGFYNVAAAMFSVNFIVPNFYLLGIGKTTWTAASSLAQGIIMVSANLLLIPILGLVGTGWAFLLGTAVAEVMHVFIWRVSFRTKVSAGVYFSTFLEPSAVGVILGTGLLMLRSSIRWVPNLLEILGWGVACGVLTMLLCILADSILPGGSERRREAIQLAYRLLSRPRRSTREVR